MQQTVYQLGQWTIHPEQNLISDAQQQKHLDRKAMQVLMVLIQHAGQRVSKQQLFDEIWKDKAVTDDILSVSVSNIRKALGDNARAPTFIKTLPGFGYCLIAEVTPVEEIRASEEKAEVAEPAVTTTPSHRSMKIGAAIIAFCLIAIVIWNDFVSEQPAEIQQQPFNQRVTVAVMPFINLGLENNNPYFSDGLTDVILDRLARVKDMDVLDRHSTFAIRDKYQSAREIGKALGVSHVIQGSVQEHQGQVRVIVQLISAHNNNQLWSRTFDRPNDAVFNVQDEISQSVLDYLSPENASISVPSRAISEEAWDLYLYGRFYWQQRTKESLAKAVGYFQQATDKEPLFAEAYLGLANSYQFQFMYGGLTFEQAREKALPALRKARELAPDMGDVYASMGLLLTDEALQSSDVTQMNGLFKEAEASFKTARELMGDTFTTLHWYGRLLYAMGNYKGANQLFEKAARLNPLSPALYWVMSQSLQALGKEDSAQRTHKRAAELSSTTHTPQIHNVEILRLERTLLQALLPWVSQQTDAQLADEFWLSPLELGVIYLGLDDTKRADKWFARLDSQAGVADQQRHWLEVIKAGEAGDNPGVISGLEKLQALMPQHLGVKSDLARAKLYAGDVAGAKALIEEMYPNLEQQFIPDGDNYQNLFTYALSLKSSSPEMARKHLQQLFDYLEQADLYSRSQALMNQAEICSELAEYDKALSYLQQAMDAGWLVDLNREWWTLDTNPHFKALESNDGFKRISASLKAAQADLLKL